VDNFYSAPALSKKLEYMKNCAGTQCLNREDVTKIVKDKNYGKWKL
jgi:hypothetical protein